jgi:hypothetical protein
MSSYENYKQALQAIGNRSAALLSGVQTELAGIELDIRWAIKGTPKKEAESRFAEAKRRITEDINAFWTSCDHYFRKLPSPKHVLPPAVATTPNPP